MGRKGWLRLTVVAAATLAAACGVSSGRQADERPFAAEITAFAAADAARPPEACRVLFVGSSSIRFWDTLDADMAPIEVVQRGFGGSEMEHVNLYFEDIVAPYHPRAIVLYEGENDLSLGKNAEAVLGDVERFLALKSDALGETPVYFLSIKPSKLRFEQRPQQQAANTMVAALAAERDDLMFVDVASAMLREDGTPKDIFIEDDLHMTAEGYAIWAPIVRAALEAPAPTRAPGCG